MEAAMKIFPMIPLVFLAPAAGAQTITQNQIQHVTTSLNHLTILEFGQPITTLAVGDPDNFQIERHGDKVFVKPLRDGVSTNLFVWTATREISYELDPAGQLASMDVLIRTDAAPNSRASVQVATEPSDEEIRKIASLVLSQALMGVEDIVRDPRKSSTGRVEVDLDQIYRTRDQLFVRYSITNLTQSPFRVTSPDISRPLPTERPISLVSLRDHQLAPRTFSAFKAKQSTSVPVLRAECASRDLAPGEKTGGVISFQRPAGDAPELYEFSFGRDQSGPLRVEAVF
jgi:hypothetical protein